MSIDLEVLRARTEAAAACSGFTNAAPYCANKSLECTDAHEWCIDDKCKGFRPNACEARKEQKDG